MIFETPPLPYYAPKKEEWFFVPQYALIKTGFKNFTTFFANRRIDQENQLSLVGRTKLFTYAYIYPLCGKKAPEQQRSLLKEIALSKVTRDILTGVTLALIALPIMTFLQICFYFYFLSKGIDLTENKQEIAQVYENTDLLPPVAKLFIKALLINYITFHGPIIEEQIFRGRLYKMVHSWQGEDKNSLQAKTVRVVSNGLLFGAIHLSFSQGWLNIPIFIVTSLLGTLFAWLRESKGSLIPSTAAHITYNSAVTLLSKVA